MGNTLRIGIIGAGSVARRIHAPGLRLCEDVKIVAVADPDAEAAASLKAPEIHADYRELLARPDVDAVVIAVPNNQHREIALAALAAGKHTLCEKPLAMNAAEAEEMLEAAQKSGVIHMTAFTYGFTPSARYLTHLVRQGELGEIRSVRAAYLMALSKHLLGWRSRRELAGSGVLGDIGSHLIHIVLELAGDIKTLSARQKDFRKDPTSDVEDWIAFLAEFENGACGTFEISRVCPGRGADVTEDMFIEIYGTKGGAVFSMQEPRALQVCLGARADEPANQLERVQIPQDWWKLPGAPRHVSEGDPRWSYRFDQAWRFVSAIREGAAPEPSFEAGLRTQRVLDAALASAASGAWTPVGA
ncbi:MAG: gfo/Idh/MocA family oxidoreductase [Acidobacteria bacterium]|nr:gfo/Idh/MocA family oxidoreductase [Acidobacteriota bacterium]